MPSKHIDAIRSFNRFYTDIAGLLNRFILKSNYSLPEVRILYEIYHQPSCSAKKIMETFAIDKGYLSRILLKFHKKKILEAKRSKSDGRSLTLVLTPKGRQEFEKLNAATDQQIRALLAKVSANRHDDLIYHMNEIKKILSIQ